MKGAGKIVWRKLIECWSHKLEQLERNKIISSTAHSFLQIETSLKKPLRMSPHRAAALAAFLSTCAAQPSFNCNPCINRGDHVVKAVIQGTKSDPFWQQIEGAMRQSERDMRVKLDMELYDTLDTEKMAADIRAAVRAADPPEALIVTIPSDNVKAAVAEAVEARLPVFGMYSGYEHFDDLKMQGFVAMDQKEAGIAAGKKFLDINEGITNVAYITPGTTDGDFDAKRLEGLRTEINDVKEIEKSSVNFVDCPYDAVLLASADLLEEVLESYDKNGCNPATNPIASFDHSKSVHQSLSSGKLAFAISEQQYLQGAFSVMAATLFATTGKALASSSESIFEMQTVGPVITTKDSPLSDSMQNCKDDAFPVCPNTLALDGMSGSVCDCTDRKKIKIAGVLHAVKTDEFWDVVYESTQHAADDFGVELELDRMEPNDDPDVLHGTMAGQIERLCREGVDGIFVTIPNESVLDEIQYCLDRGTPVVSINAGPEYSKDLTLYHHIGMVEKNAGFQAGKRMAETGQMTKAVCLMHAPNNVVLTDRCGGFRDGVAATDPDIEYLGDVNVPEDNDSKYVKDVENHIKDKLGAEGGDWEGIGIMTCGQPQIEAAVMLKNAHSKVLLGAFDTNEVLWDALDDKDIMFSIDQGPYLQGYLPVALLTWYAYTKQQLSNHLVESGPAFITEAPSAEETACQKEHFPVCARPESVAAPSQQVAATTEQAQGAIIAVSVIIVVLALTVGFLLYRVHQLNSFVRRMRDSGQEVPKVTAGSYCSGMYQSPEEVVRRMNSASVS